MKTPISIFGLKLLLLFSLATTLLYVVLTHFIPLLRSQLSVAAALSWFIGGTFVFKPMLMLALGLSWWPLRFKNWAGLQAALCLHPLSRRDWRYSLIGLGLIFGGMGLVFGAVNLLHHYVGTPMPEITPPALSFPPFQGTERWLLLVWAVMFFFNIVGEECFWRGFILRGQLKQPGWEGRFAPLINTVIWAGFHVPFGWSMVLLASPAFLVIPCVFAKTRNTTTSILIHGLMNGPVFVMMALGLVSPSHF